MPGNNGHIDGLDPGDGDIDIDLLARRIQDTDQWLIELQFGALRGLIGPGPQSDVHAFILAIIGDDDYEFEAS